MSKKSKSASKRRLDSLILILLLTAVLLVMSTYAWFTANRTVNVDRLNVQINTSSGLQISADGETWKSSIELQDIINADFDNTQLPAMFEPVSTVGAKQGNGLVFYHGNVIADLVSGGYQLSTTDITNKEGKTNGQYYAAFDIYFKKSGGNETNFYVNCAATETDDTFKNAATTPRGIDNATRVGLIKGGHTAGDSNVTTIRGLNTQGEITIMEPNANTHSATGIANANYLKGLNADYLKASDGTTLTTAIGAAAPTSGIAYDGVNGVIPESGRILLQNCTNAKDSTNFSVMGNSMVKFLPKGNTTGVNLKGAATYGLESGITKYRVYLWVEGQDVDCEDAASGSYLQFNLTFSLDETIAFPALPKSSGSGDQVKMGDPKTTP